MVTEAVCAVIVTYHPDAVMLQNLRKTLAQVQGMVVVDNGSASEELQPFRAAKETLGFKLIENSHNLGVAEALNQGVQWAKSEGFPWVMLFDQDSKITDGFVRLMYETWEGHPQRDRVCSIHPRYIGPSTGAQLMVPRERDGGPFVSMTSGSMLPTWIFDKIGWFATEYFIDYVDWEYCARIRAAGYLIADSRKATLLHAAGDPTRVSLLGRTFQPSHHSAMRRYYITRNSITFYRKYFKVFPRQIAYSAYWMVRGTLKCFLLERNRGRKFRNFLLGTWDGAMGRMGKREGL